MTGDCEEGVGEARLTCRRGGRCLSARMHQSAVTDGCQNRWKRQVSGKNSSSKITLRNCNCLARSKGEVVENATILAQGEFAFGAAVEIVKDNLGEPALRQIAEVLDIDDAGRC